MRYTGIISLTLGIFLILGACRKRPEGVLSDSQMESLLTDLLLAESYQKTNESRQLPDSIRRTLGESILKKHEVDRAQLDSTYSWYSKNLDDYYKLYDKVERNLLKERKKAGLNVENENLNDIWTLPKHMILSPMALGSTLTFNLPGETLAGGEQLHWKMKMNGATAVDVLLGIDYSDGTGSITRREFQGGNIDLTIVADTALHPRRIYGFIAANRRDLPIWLDSISLAKNPFDSVAYSSINNQRKITPPSKRITPKEDKSRSDSVLNFRSIPDKLN